MSYLLMCYCCSQDLGRSLRMTVLLQLYAQRGFCQCIVESQRSCRTLQSNMIVLNFAKVNSWMSIALKSSILVEPTGPRLPWLSMSHSSQLVNL